MRSSKDSGWNKEGEEIIQEMVDAGLDIGNGYVEGDKEGEWTFIGMQGKSVIDYVLINGNGIEEISRMEIKERTESDYLPILVEINSV